MNFVDAVCASDAWQTGVDRAALAARASPRTI
jgi:hypothetical protein